MPSFQISSSDWELRSAGKEEKTVMVQQPSPLSAAWTARVPGLLFSCLLLVRAWHLSGIKFWFQQSSCRISSWKQGFIWLCGNYSMCLRCSWLSEVSYTIPILNIYKVETQDSSQGIISFLWQADHSLEAKGGNTLFYLIFHMDKKKHQRTKPKILFFCRCNSFSWLFYVW